MATQHNHPAAFGKKYDDCPRCQELKAGDAPRQSWHSGWKQQQAQRLIEIRKHDCKASRCGVVCTAFDW